MNRLARFLGLGAILWQLSSATQATFTSQLTTQVTPPSQDPWYSAPPGFEKHPPSTILKVREAPGNLTTTIGNVSRALNILYTTTDSRYQPSWAVTTVLVPNSFYTSPSGKAALLSYHFAYDSASIDSGPSYGLYYEIAQPNPSLGIPAGTDLLTIFLSEGWIVNVPDYEGPTAAFGASVQAGHATIDSLRAVLGTAPIPEAKNVNVALWGYSGGSIATEAAAELQVQYAPELTISGAAMGGVVVDFAANFHLLSGTPLAGDLVAGLLGVTAQYPEARAYLRSRLHAENGTEFLSNENMTTTESLTFFANKDIYSYFVGGAADLQAPVLRKVYNVEMKLGYHGVPAMPLFVYKAIGDEICPVAETDALVDKYCDVGADITYERNTVGGHVTEIVNGQDRAINWLRGIFNESYVPNASGCAIRDVTVNATNPA